MKPSTGHLKTEQAGLHSHIPAASNLYKAIHPFVRNILSLATLVIVLFALQGCDKDDNSPPPDESKYQELRSAMRVLWSDHAIWTRNVIINIVDGAPGTTEAVNRLLANQEDIGNAIKPYYGASAGDELTILLKEHITTAADILVAARDDNGAAYDAALANWYVNGDEIATFLNTANPDNWQLAHWKTMMKTHLDLTLDEAAARLAGDYTADVLAYDKVYDELMLMSDMLSEGIALQFPDQF